MWLPFKVLIFILVAAVVVAGFLFSRKPAVKLPTSTQNATSTESEPPNQSSVQFQPLVLSDLNLTLDNYPKVGGSTSTQSLGAMLACRSLKFFCFWSQDTTGLKKYYSADPRLAVSHQGTRQAFLDLINKKSDLILVDSMASTSEQELAKSLNVALDTRAVALGVYAVTRGDTSQPDLAYKLREWLLTTEGQAVMAESGLAPLTQ